MILSLTRTSRVGYLRDIRRLTVALSRARFGLYILGRREVFETYNTGMDEALKQLLWNSEGQGGYFINEYGRVGTQMPWTADQFYELVRKSDPQSYVFS